MFRITRDDLELVWGLKEYPRKVEHAATKALHTLGEERSRLIEQLSAEKKKFEAGTATFSDDVKRVKSLTGYQEMENNVDDANATMDSIELAEEQAEGFNMRERVLGLHMSHHPTLLTCREDCQPYHELWNMIFNFHTSSNEWLCGPFTALEAVEIEKSIDGWWKRSFELYGFLVKENPEVAACAECLHEETDKFRQHLPLITALTRPSMRERHWECISGILGSEIDVDDELTFQMLLNMDINDFFEDLEEVCISAEKEYGLERALHAMKSEWSTIELSITDYKETGTYAVSGVDEIIGLMDDHIIKTQTMQGSPFIKPIAKSSGEWERKLKYGQSLMDELIACQKAWMYLEPIFCSDDIKRSLPTESKRFQGVDSLWRSVMSTYFSNPNYMTHAEEEKGLEQKLKVSNRKLEEIQKGLADYLETKVCFLPSLGSSTLLLFFLHRYSRTHIFPFSSTRLMGKSDSGCTSLDSFSFQMTSSLRFCLRRKTPELFSLISTKRLKGYLV